MAAIAPCATSTATQSARFFSREGLRNFAQRRSKENCNASKFPLLRLIADNHRYFADAITSERLQTSTSIELARKKFDKRNWTKRERILNAMLLVLRVKRIDICKFSTLVTNNSRFRFEATFHTLASRLSREKNKSYVARERRRRSVVLPGSI